MISNRSLVPTGSPPPLSTANARGLGTSTDCYVCYRGQDATRKTVLIVFKALILCAALQTITTSECEVAPAR